MRENIFYNYCLDELKRMIPAEKMKRVLSQEECEYEHDFFGFIDIYAALSTIIPKSKIVIDFGCYLAAQSYFFKDHRQYIGVDICNMERFKPDNARQYYCTIQQFIQEEVPILFANLDNLSYFAICSYVPDFKATELVRKTFQNVLCYYPGGAI